MAKYKLTVAGAFNHPPLVIGSEVLLVKEPNNSYDDEAIRIDVHTPPLKWQPNGYVANTYKTRRKGTVSGSRLYDRLADKTPAIVISEDTLEVEVD